MNIIEKLNSFKEIINLSDKAKINDSFFLYQEIDEDGEIRTAFSTYSLNQKRNIFKNKYWDIYIYDKNEETEDIYSIYFAIATKAGNKLQKIEIRDINHVDISLEKNIATIIISTEFSFCKKNKMKIQQKFKLIIALDAE